MKPLPKVLIRYLKVFIEKIRPNPLPTLNIAPQNLGVMSKALLSLLCFIFLTLSANAQEKWSLERCVKESLDKNLTIQQFKLNKQGADITSKQLRFERIPSLNASTDFGVSFGRVINPVSNDFETDNSFYQSLGVNAGVTLFNGFRIRNSIRQNDFYVSAAGEDIRQAQNDLALNVALAYLNVLFAYENLQIAKDRVELSKHQLENTDKLIDAGSRPENDRLDILSQIAIDEQSLITAQNNIDINLLSLKQQMLMEADYPLEIERPTIDLTNLEALENQTFEAVYSSALSSQPQINAAEMREKASELGIPIARSMTLPSIALGGNLGSNWSDLAKQPGNYINQRIPQQGIYINGDPALFEVESLIPTSFNAIPYGKQLDQNIGYGIGASLSIPIFNNYSGKANIQKAKINVLNASIQTDQIKQTLKTNIQNAIASARASRKSLDGAEASVHAARVALDNANRKAEIGTLTNFEYLSVRNRSDAAENNLLIARYDYYFKVKVIEYYMGRGIRLN
jgi:outer membrane protein